MKGYDLELWQHNATVVVPFLVSSRGYGILWDNPSYTRFGDLREWAPIPADRLLDASGRPGGLTGSYHAGAGFETLVATRVDPGIDIEIPGGTKQPNLRIHPSLPPEGETSVRWEGAVEAAESGDHLFQLYSNGGIRMWVDGRLVADHWRQGWLPWKDVARVPLEKGRRHRLKIEWSKDQGMETLRLRWKTPAKERSTSLWSEVGDGVDYWFVYGPSLDRVTAGYRRLTGEAPMMPRWAFGLWQSRQRYETQAQSLDVVDGFRSRRIPFDNIVQDWFYWPETEWGSHRFDPAALPRPRRLGAGDPRPPRAAHDLGLAQVLPRRPRTSRRCARRASSTRAPCAPGSRTGSAPGTPTPSSTPSLPGPGSSSGSRSSAPSSAAGVDAWWMDASEPDLVQPMPELDLQRAAMHPTAMGTGASVLNAYSLVNSQGIYEGQRAKAPDQRVLVLTRSAYAGQQRYAAATWSGRRHLDLDGAAPAGRGRARLLALGDPLLDGGHRRILRPGPLLPEGPAARGRRGVARAQHPLVPVRHLPALDPRPRGGPEARDVGDGRRGAPRLPGAPQVRPPPLPDAALRRTLWPGR